MRKVGETWDALKKSEKSLLLRIYRSNRGDKKQVMKDGIHYHGKEHGRVVNGDERGLFNRIRWTRTSSTLRLTELGFKLAEYGAKLDEAAKKATSKKPVEKTPRKKFKVEETTMKLSDAIAHPSDLDDLRDEMTEWRDNIEDTLSHTEKYQNVSDAAEELESICNELEPVCESLCEILKNRPIFATEVVVKTRRPYGRSPARWLRLDNAIAPLQAAMEKIQAEFPRVVPLTERTAEEAAFVASIYEQLDDLSSQLDQCANISFPGMYG